MSRAPSFNIKRETDEPEKVESFDCPKCGSKTPVLKKIEAGMRLSLTKEGILEYPVECCDICFREFERLVSKGAKLRAEAIARDQQRLYLWRNRTNMVKQGRQLMAQKVYSEAAIMYEKYLKIIEIVYQVKPPAITPDLFKGRPSELTLVASVYWDLLRVYDTHERYQDRQMIAAEKLAMFIRFTPLLPTITKKAQILCRTGRNPDAFKKFLKLADKEAPRCFIATAAFDGQRTETVQTLCVFRDEVLKNHSSGRAFVALYYRLSPGIAEFLDHTPFLKAPCRIALKSMALVVEKTFKLTVKN